MPIPTVINAKLTSRTYIDIGDVPVRMPPSNSAPLLPTNEKTVAKNA